jgi:hypothetical protein
MTDNSTPLRDALAQSIADALNDKVVMPSDFFSAEAILATPEMQAIRQWINERRYDHDWYTGNVVDDALTDLPPSVVVWVDAALPSTDVPPT